MFGFGLVMMFLKIFKSLGQNTSLNTGSTDEHSSLNHNVAIKYAL
jgi:hypothetical protein